MLRYWELSLARANPFETLFPISKYVYICIHVSITVTTIASICLGCALVFSLSVAPICAQHRVEPLDMRQEKREGVGFSDSSFLLL